MTYQAPVRDIMFNIEHLSDWPGVASLAAYSGIETGDIGKGLSAGLTSGLLGGIGGRLVGNLAGNAATQTAPAASRHPFARAGYAAPYDLRGAVSEYHDPLAGSMFNDGSARKPCGMCDVCGTCFGDGAIWRTICFGVPAALIVGGALALERSGAVVKNERFTYLDNLIFSHAINFSETVYT